MSKMRMYCAGVGTIFVNVTSFQSTLDGQIVPSQTKQALHHYPRKASHQSIAFQVQCRDANELNTIQTFIRRHQKYALTSPPNPEIMLWWPQRGIRDWSGIIKRVEAGDRRFNPSPKVNFTVDLVNSLMSKKTWWSSAAEDFDKFFDTAINPSSEWSAPLPSLPNLPESDWGGGGAGGNF